MTAPAPRRLELSAAEFDSLVRRTGARLPPPFDVVATADGSGPVHPSVAANLSVLADPDLLVRVDARLPGGGSRAVFTVAGPLGASLFAKAGADGRSASSRAGADGRSASSRAEGAVELSMFAAVSLGRELIRGVPELPPAVPAARVHDSLSPSPSERTGAWAGRAMKRTALAEYGPARRLFGATGAADALGLDAAEADLVAGLTERTRGSLRALVHGGRPVDGGLLVGQLVWVATDVGWFELVPSDVDSVVPLPVTRASIGTRLAPFIAQILLSSPDAGHDAA